MQNENDFSHFNAEGRARMVNVSDKPVTARTARAEAAVILSPETFRLVQTGGIKKGDVLTVAQVAGIMGAKHTPDLIPMCHPVCTTGADISFTMDEETSSVIITSTVSCEGKTGVEMEALTAVTAAALTVYDMCKAVQKDIVIKSIRLLEKTGGIHGEYRVEQHKEKESFV